MTTKSQKTHLILLSVLGRLSCFHERYLQSKNLEQYQPHSRRWDDLRRATQSPHQTQIQHRNQHQNQQKRITVRQYPTINLPQTTRELEQLISKQMTIALGNIRCIYRGIRLAANGRTCVV